MVLFSLDPVPTLKLKAHVFEIKQVLYARFSEHSPPQYAIIDWLAMVSDRWSIYNAIDVQGKTANAKLYDRYSCALPGFEF